jgi:hypothetical protein
MIETTKASIASPTAMTVIVINSITQLQSDPLSGSLKAEGFGDGYSARSHPQAALEAATLPDY